MSDNPVLTPRQSEVMRLMAEGHTKRQVAALLYVEVRTVDVHLNRLYRLLGAHNRAEALQLARQRGLLS